MNTSPAPTGSSARSTSPASRETPASARSVLFNDLPIDPSNDEYILVVGGLGYIGSHTVWELLKEGRNVVVVDNFSNSFKVVLEKLEQLRDTHYQSQASKPKLDFYMADYRDRKLMREILSKYNRSPVPGSVTKSRIAGVIHFAAYKAVAESFQKPLEYYANNVGGMIDFCATLGEFGIKTFVFSSSATVYGELANQGKRLTEDQCNNTGCTGLTNPYGRTKWMCEAILSDLAYSDPEWTIVALRYFNPIGCDESGLLGEDPRDNPNNLMPIVVKAMLGQLPALSIFGTDWDTRDGTAIRDFIHVSDLAEGHLAALKTTSRSDFGPGYHIFNLGTGTGQSVSEIVSTMQRVSGRTIPTIQSGRREGDVGICIAEPSKSAVSLGWKTKRSLTQACQDICGFLKINISGVAA
ncbi:UDP-glucose 4-epimerase [Tothia fuscella]|uniref:UDP-glucose 4-epimerase n=1 Tax=Tothia fuscella TaxID=1048955 RepID=A0A9P4NUH2_9PEZI|nr:UDP-glucose 4-epimerase [Tothia fuscella]